MSRRTLMTAVMVGWLAAGNGFGEEKTADPLPALLAKLRQPIELGAAGTELSLRDFAELASARLGVPVVLSLGSDEGGQVGMTDQVKIRLLPNKLPFAKLLPSMPGGEKLIPFVRADHVLIVTEAEAARLARIADDELDGNRRLREPLVSAVVQERPLAEAVAELAKEYDATVVLPPQTIGARDVAVSARMLNVPLNRALELLAAQADLRVVAKGNAFLVTTRDHANQMANDEREQAEQKFDLERIRSGAPAPMPPPPPPAEAKPKDEKKD